MKKILAILVALTMLLALTACGEKTNEPNGTDDTTASSNTAVGVGSEGGNSTSTLKIKSIKIGNTTYGDDGAISLNVTVDWEGTPADDAWIGIIPAEVPHGSEEKNDEYDITYLYLKDLKSGTQFALDPVTLEPGEYTLRINESDAGGAELAWCGFSVSKGNKVRVDGKESTLLQGGENNGTGIAADGSMLGVLQPVAEQQDFIIKGLYISSESGQHKYMHAEDIDTFGTDSLNSEFELNEWIGFYVDTESQAPMNIYIVRNDAQADYSKITAQELESICADNEYPVIADAVPDEENRGFAGQAYVHPESSEPDLFNVFFTANGEVCYMVQLNIIAQADS